MKKYEIKKIINQDKHRNTLTDSFLDSFARIKEGKLVIALLSDR